MIATSALLVLLSVATSASAPTMPDVDEVTVYIHEADIGASGSGEAGSGSGSGEPPSPGNYEVSFSMVSTKSASYFTQSIQQELTDAMALATGVESADVTLTVASARRRRLSESVGATSSSTLTWVITAADNDEASGISSKVSAKTASQWTQYFTSQGVPDTGVSSVTPPTITNMSGGGSVNNTSLLLGLILGLGLPVLGTLCYLAYKRSSRAGRPSEEGVLQLTNDR